MPGATDQPSARTRESVHADRIFERIGSDSLILVRMRLCPSLTYIWGGSFRITRAIASSAGRQGSTAGDAGAGVVDVAEE